MHTHAYYVICTLRIVAPALSGNQPPADAGQARREPSVALAPRGVDLLCERSLRLHQRHFTRWRVSDAHNPYHGHHHARCHRLRERQRERRLVEQGRGRRWPCVSCDSCFWLRHRRFCLRVHAGRQAPRRLVHVDPSGLSQHARVAVAAPAAAQRVPAQPPSRPRTSRAKRGCSIWQPRTLRRVCRADRLLRGHIQLQRSPCWAISTWSPSASTTLQWNTKKRTALSVAARAREEEKFTQ
jgi:hypothetical protein